MLLIQHSKLPGRKAMLLIQFRKTAVVRKLLRLQMLLDLKNFLGLKMLAVKMILLLLGLKNFPGLKKMLAVEMILLLLDPKFLGLKTGLGLKMILPVPHPTLLGPKKLLDLKSLLEKRTTHLIRHLTQCHLASQQCSTPSYPSTVSWLLLQPHLLSRLPALRKDFS